MSIWTRLEQDFEGITSKMQENSKDAKYCYISCDFGPTGEQWEKLNDALKKCTVIENLEICFYFYHIATLYQGRTETLPRMIDKKGLQLVLQDGLKAVSNSKQLKKMTLCLSGAIGIDESRLLGEALQNNNTLVMMSLCCSDIGDEGLMNLKPLFQTCSKLQRLIMMYDNIGNGLKSFISWMTENKMTKLITLSLGGNRFSSTGVGNLGEFLKCDASSNLVELSLEENSLGAEGCKRICEGLENNVSLIDLNLKGNQIGDEGCKWISTYLKDNCTLTHLNIAKNGIKEAGVKQLSEFLHCNSTISELDLDFNTFGFNGLKSLCEELKTNTSLLCVSMRSIGMPSMGQAAWSTIGNTLRKNSTLQTLKFGFERIRSIDIEQFGPGLENSLGLKKLSFFSMDVGQSEYDALIPFLKKSETLQEMDLCFNVIGPNQFNASYSELKSNYSLTNISFYGKLDHQRWAALFQRNKDYCKTADKMYSAFVGHKLGKFFADIDLVFNSFKEIENP